MPHRREKPSENSTVAGTGARWSVPRGLVAGTLVALALAMAGLDADPTQ